MGKFDIAEVTTISGDLTDLLLYRPELARELVLLGFYSGSFETSDRFEFAIVPKYHNNFRRFLETETCRRVPYTTPGNITNRTVEGFVVNFRLDRKEKEFRGDVYIRFKDTLSGSEEVN